MVNRDSTPPRLAEFWQPIIPHVHAALRAAAQEDANSMGARIMAAVERAVVLSREQGYASEQIEQAKFVIIAWIDETVMTRSWPGAIAWRLAPLQKRYFSTTRSGVEFFQRLESLDPADIEVREVYGLALAAGFQGHYGMNGPEALADYRRQALADILRESRAAPLEQGRPLFPLAQPVHRKAGAYSRRVQPMLTALLVIILPLIVLVTAYMVFDAMLAGKVAALIEMS